MKIHHALGHSARALVVAVLAGCTTGTGAPAPATTTAGPAPVTTATTASGFGTRHVTLTCADSLLPREVDASGLEDGGFVIQGLTVRADSVPLAEDVGVRLPPGLRWYFRKAPVAVAANAPDVTVAVSGPGQALAWVPSVAWTAAGAPELGTWSAASVTFQSCPDRNAMFLGGILAADLDTCIRLRARSSARELTVHQRLDATACTG